MTFKQMAKELKYKQYDENKRTLKRQIEFQRDVAEEINKIMEVLRIHSDVRVTSAVIVDIGMRYFFEYLEHLDEEDAVELFIKGVLLKW